MLIYMLLFLFLGLIFGSFLNSLIYRWQANISLWGRSFCPLCKHKLAWYDLIPFLSFIFLGAKCRYCQKKISWEYLAVEIITGILFALAYWQIQAINLLLFRNLFFVLVLILIFIFDLKYYLILDKIIWPALLVSLFINLVLNVNWLDLLLGIVIGSGFFLLQHSLSKGQWIGSGDVKLGALLGAMFGWQLTLLIIILAYFIGGICGIILLASGKKKFGDILPMGAFLASAGIIALFLGQRIINYYF